MNTPPGANYVAATWHEFEQKMLAAVGDPAREVRALVKVSFYFGHIAMLGMIESVVEQAKGQKSIERVLQGLREEIDETMERSAVWPN